VSTRGRATSRDGADCSIAAAIYRRVYSGHEWRSLHVFLVHNIGDGTRHKGVVVGWHDFRSVDKS
jgi:hypothetical protein